jgi:squalene-hopene/tetraprenyl-beta-curcumene cyclase
MGLLATEADFRSNLDGLILEAREALKDRQQDDGHWIFEFEADATIPAEYILLQHFLGALDPRFTEEVQPKIANYLRDVQSAHGGWPLFHDGEFDMSATVKAYYALKLAGDDPEAPHMARAREAVLARGGARRGNVFTRIALALFGQVPWRAVPVMPIEITLLPRWFPFHLEKVSYWSRTVIVPLLILMALKPRAKNPLGLGVRELFTEDPERTDYKMNATGTALGAAFAAFDRVLRKVEPGFPKAGRAKAIRKALEFIEPRLNGEDGLFRMARAAVDKLLMFHGDRAYCQPCLSPIWDTCLGLHALLEAREERDSPAVAKAVDWLLEREITGTYGDWIWRRPGLNPSGWAFQYWNNYYPDVDDTAVVVMALERTGDPRCRPAIERAAQWVVGMQSSSGGWGSFDPENEYTYLNHIPFADHGALLDPPTVDVTARCLSMLAQLGYPRGHPAVEKAVAFLKREQEADGSWFGRWGANYVYGTWSALSALNAVSEDPSEPYIRRAAEWLKAFQRADGGWGECCSTYWDERRGAAKSSTPSQTAWALLGLMAAGEVDSEAAARGVAYLETAPRDGAKWDEVLYTGIGFPRVFYLRYDGYSAYFPLWALARYRNLMDSNDRRVALGM